MLPQVLALPECKREMAVPRFVAGQMPFLYSRHVLAQTACPGRRCCQHGSVIARWSPATDVVCTLGGLHALLPCAATKVLVMSECDSRDGSPPFNTGCSCSALHALSPHVSKTSLPVLLQVLATSECDREMAARHSGFGQFEVPFLKSRQGLKVSIAFQATLCWTSHDAAHYKGAATPPDGLRTLSVAERQYLAMP